MFSLTLHREFTVCIGLLIPLYESQKVKIINKLFVDIDIIKTLQRLIPHARGP